MRSTTKRPVPRQAERSTTLISARALVGKSEWSVKIRDLSHFGALLDSDVQLDVGCSIVLVRNKLRVAGEVAWCRERSIGVRFFEALELSAWLHGTSMAGTGQKATSSNALEPEVEVASSVLVERMSEEISYVARTVLSVVELLSDDPILRVRHASRIQSLCIGEQMLQELSKIILEPDTYAAVRQIATGSMRNRLLR